jgi:hypothetical protein
MAAPAEFGSEGSASEFGSVYWFKKVMGSNIARARGLDFQRWQNKTIMSEEGWHSDKQSGSAGSYEHGFAGGWGGWVSISRGAGLGLLLKALSSWGIGRPTSLYARQR